jgi:hypothetical protein
MTLLLFGASLACLATSACDLPDRVSRLEKENKELKAEVSSPAAVADYDLQAKCSKDAREWFNVNWAGGRDKDTLLLEFTNHYNKKQNKCFIFVEYHYNSHLAGREGWSWTNDMSLWDVYENFKYANFGGNTYTYYKPTISTSTEVITCEANGQKCKTVEEFNSFVRPYLND